MKIFKKLLILSLMLIVLSGTNFAAEETVISVLGSSGGYGKALRFGVEMFNKQYEGQYRAELTETTLGSIVEKAIFQFISGTCIFDVLSINSNYMGQFNNYFANLDEYFENDGLSPAEIYGEGNKRVGSYNGHFVAAPVRGGTFATFYRKDLFEEAGLEVPNSLDEWLSAARKLTIKASDGSVERYGTSLKLSDGWNVGQTLGFFLFGGGGRFLTDDRSAVHPSLTGDFAEEVLIFMKTLWDEQLIPDPIGFDYSTNINAIQNGKVCFSDEYTPRSTLVNDPEYSKVAGKVAFALPPFEQHVLGGSPSLLESSWFIGIDKNSDNKQGSYELIKFLTNFETQKTMALEYSNQPVVLKVLEDTEYLDFNPCASIVKEAQKYNPKPGLLGLAETPRIYDEWKVEIHHFMLGDQSAKETLSNIAKITTQYLEK